MDASSSVASKCKTLQEYDLLHPVAFIDETCNLAIGSNIPTDLVICRYHTFQPYYPLYLAGSPQMRLCPRVCRTNIGMAQTIAPTTMAVHKWNLYQSGCNQCSTKQNYLPISVWCSLPVVARPTPVFHYCQTVRSDYPTPGKV